MSIILYTHEFFSFPQKYYLCCCRLSEREILDQQDEHATLNDFLFEVENHEDVGRLNVSHVSELTNDNYYFRDDDDDGGNIRPPTEVSIQSIFPDLLGDELQKQQQGNNNTNNRNGNTNSLSEPLLPRRQNNATNNSNNH